MKELTKAEEEIMQHLWQLQEAKVAEIIEQIPQPKPAYNTVSTIIRILEQKKFVGYKKQGRGHVYFPLVSKSAYSKSRINNFLDNYFDGNTKSMFSFFVKKNDLSINDLEEILKELKNNKNE